MYYYKNMDTYPLHHHNCLWEEAYDVVGSEERFQLCNILGFFLLKIRRKCENTHLAVLSSGSWYTVAGSWYH